MHLKPVLELSYTNVMNDVAKIRANIFELNGKEYVQRTQFQGQAYIAFKVTGTKIPSEFLSINTLTQNTESVVTTSL